MISFDGIVLELVYCLLYCVGFFVGLYYFDLGIGWGEGKYVVLILRI